MTCNDDKKKFLEKFIKLAIAFSIFFFVFMIVVFLGSIPPSLTYIVSFFKETNATTTLDFFTNVTDNSINFNESVSFNNSTNFTTINTSAVIYNYGNNSSGIETISSIIGLLGFFAVFAYLFYSIKENTLLNNENQRLRIGFLIGIFIVVFLIGFIFSAFNKGNFLIIKYMEISGLIGLLIITVIFAVYFHEIHNQIEENYQNRIRLLNFLEIQDSIPIISQPIDNLCRYIVLKHEFISNVVLIAIVLIPIYGVIVGLNLLSIIFLELINLLLFNGFCRLISLCCGSSNITLKSRLSTTEFSYCSKFIRNIFFLPSFEESHFKILTGKGSISISKNEVVCIHDNELIIFKGKEKLLPLNIWARRAIRFTLLLISSYILYNISFLSLLFIVIHFNPIILTGISNTSLNRLLFTIGGLCVVTTFSLICFFIVKIDNYAQKIVDKNFIVPEEYEY